MGLLLGIASESIDAGLESPDVMTSHAYPRRNSANEAKGMHAHKQEKTSMISHAHGGHVHVHAYLPNGLHDHEIEYPGCIAANSRLREHGSTARIMHESLIAFYNGPVECSLDALPQGGEIPEANIENNSCSACFDFEACFDLVERPNS